MTKSKLILAAVALLLLSLPAMAAPPRVAVGDFTVTSDDPKLKYVGKGLAEMVAAELAASKGVTLIDRDKREAALGELEFSLSGMASSESQVEAGKLLSADYLVFGEIIDMAGQVLVSCKAVKVETGEVAWSDKSLGKLSDYSKISRGLASSALKGLGSEKAATAAAAAKPESKASEAKKVEAIVAFSGAVDALDKKDKEEAKRRIQTAKAIDPGNAAVAAYAAKLAGGNPRFLVELEAGSPTYNPALLAFEDKLKAFYWWSNASPTGKDLLENDIIEVEPTSDKADTIVYKEALMLQRGGVIIPIGSRFGLMAEFCTAFKNGYVGSSGDSGSVWNVVNSKLDPGIRQANLDQWTMGGTLGLGCRITQALSAGASAGAVYLRKGEAGGETAVYSDAFPEAPGTYFNASAGLALKDPNGAWMADAQVAWTGQPIFILEGADDGNYSDEDGELAKATAPLLASIGGAYGFFNNKLYSSLRGIFEIGTDDRGFIALRAIPGLEYWPFAWIALRGAYEYAFVKVAEGGYTGGSASASGSGFMGGITLARWGFELSINYMNRFRPLHELPGAGHQNQAFLVGLTYSTSLVSR
jgi:TolB-like protein